MAGRTETRYQQHENQLLTRVLKPPPCRRSQAWEGLSQRRLDNEAWPLSLSAAEALVDEAGVAILGRVATAHRTLSY